MKYEIKEFNLPELKGISSKQVEVHLGLYAGYVNHTNKIREEIAKLKDSGADQYVINELRRRYAFEWNGMRMHECYFDQLEHGAKEYGDSKLAKLAAEKYGSMDGLIEHIKEVASSRGIGWIVVTHDTKADTLHTTFVADHELGQLAGAQVVLAIDVWEHAFMVDYTPAEKGKYLEAFFENLNWEVVEERCV